MDEHWRPQIDFLHYEEYSDYFCLEDFSYATKKVKEKGLEVFDTREVLGHDKSILLEIEGDFSLTPISKLRELKKKGYSPLEKSFYNLKMYEIVEEKYKEDVVLYIEKFGKKNLLKIK